MAEVQYEYVPAHVPALNLQKLMDMKTTLLEPLAVSGIKSSLSH